MATLYKEVEGEIKSCNADAKQVPIMEKAGWSAEKPKEKAADKKPAASK